jgi:hypothetical protein
MALEALALDDLTWTQLVEASRRRIMAASGSTWTLHAPVDPGMTLLELFAWLLEQRGYFADQLQPELVRAILHLLGTAPAEARPAATLLQFDGAAYREVGAGTVMRVARRTPLLEVATDHAVTLLPLGAVDAAWTSDVELAVRFDLGAAPPDAQAPLGLYIEVERSPDILPEWSPDAPEVVPPPVKLRFLYRSQGGGWRPLAGAHDGTGGLRRPGVVRLPVVADWAASAGRYELRIRADQPGFTFRPRVLRVLGNVASARHARQVNLAPFEASWLPISGHAVVDLDAGADRFAPPLPASVRLRLREARDGAWHAWERVPDLAFAGPSDRAFVVDRDQRRLLFGDGLTGRMPVLAAGASNVEVRYQAGGGSVANFAAGASFESGPHHHWTARNVVPAAGGLDAETLDDARQRLADELRRPTRAVLASDYVELARTTPGAGIARAYAGVGVHGAFPCLPVPGAVTVFVVPWAPRPGTGEPASAWDGDWVRAPQPDRGALEAARARLETARLLTTELCVRGPIYRNVRLGVRVEGNPPDAAALHADVTRALCRFLDPLVGFDGGGWRFGEPLRPSALLEEVQRALDPQSNAVEVRIVLDGVAPDDVCHDVAIASYELVTLEAVEVEIVRIVAGRGGLR